MKFQKNQRYFNRSIYFLMTFFACALFVFFLMKIGKIYALCKSILNILSPIIWGAGLAYIINPVMKRIEKPIQKVISKKKDHSKISRGISITICILFLLLLIIGLLMAVIPEITGSLKSIVSHLPDYLDSSRAYFLELSHRTFERFPQIESFLKERLDNIQVYLTNLFTQFTPKVDTILGGNSFLTSITNSAVSAVSVLKDFFIGLIVSVYILSSKEVMLSKVKRGSAALLNEKYCKELWKISTKTHHAFYSFLTGKTIDSLIIGMLTFIGLTILGIPYTFLISIIVGVTNMIPFFGPFIGAIPSGILILLSTPEKTLPFVILILALQQFDGNILGPRILGDTLGLSPFCIIFSILLGGGLFGFIGMVVFIPIFAVALSLMNEFFEFRLKKSHRPMELSAYEPGMEYPEACWSEQENESENKEESL